MRRPHQQRIGWNDNTQAIIQKLVRSSPWNDVGVNAFAAMRAMVACARWADQDGVWGEQGPLFDLDSLGIYGTDIWRLFNQVFRENALHAVAALRAEQLGLIPAEVLYAAIDGAPTPDGDVILAKVRERLPSFADPRNAPPTFWMPKKLPSLPARFVSQSGQPTAEFDAAPLLLALPAKEFNRVRSETRRRHLRPDLDALVLSRRAGIEFVGPGPFRLELDADGTAIG
jgi:hypothetical protein